MNTVQAFLQRLSQDQNLRSQIQEAPCWERGWAIAQSAGCSFTLAELENYTAQILDPDLCTLDHSEMVTIVGGFMTLARVRNGSAQEYGSIIPD